jgi:hypothetical protein
VRTNKTQTFVREPGRTADPSAPPGFPVKNRSFGGFHTALFTESRIRCRWWGREVGNPAALGGCDFFNFLWPESCEEHLPVSIAGVLRLRAVSPVLSDRSSRRFAQDDDSVVGIKNIGSSAKNKKRSKKSQALGMTKERTALPCTALPCTAASRRWAERRAAFSSALIMQPPSMEVSPSPLSSRAKPRDLRCAPAPAPRSGFC